MKRQHYRVYGIAAAGVAVTKMMLTVQSETAPLQYLVTFSGIRPQQLRMLTFPILWLLNQCGISLRLGEAIVDATACFGYFVYVSRILAHVKPDINRYSVLLAAIPLIVNYGIYGYVSYPSDLTALFLFTVAAYCILEDLHWATRIVAVLAALNRETAVLIVPLYILVNWRSKSFVRLMYEVATLTTCTIGPLLLLQQVFHHYPGALSENHFSWNLSLLRQAFTLHRPGIVYALTLFSGFHIISLVFLKRSPEFMKAAYICSILLVIVFVPVAILTEARVYNEAILGFTLPVIYGLFARTGKRAEVSRKFA
jgi:hypothetical protein